jgi:hypothetical protein
VPHLVAERITKRECKVVDPGHVEKVDLIILEILKAWTDSVRKRLRTIHQLGLRPAHDERRDDQAELEEAVGVLGGDRLRWGPLDSAGCD